MADELKDKIREYVVDEYVEEGDDVEVTDETPLITGGLVDSFSMVSLKLFLETEYDIKIPDEKATAEAFDTVNAIAVLVREYTDA
ncbi:MAG TPA: acyl carrier protein [bacterium]|nr:acyl carrier protein [bacterium]